MELIVSSNLNVFGDIFGQTIFKAIPCKHFKKILLSFGLTCKTFLKVYNKRFRPGRIDVKGWNIFKWWMVENNLRIYIGEGNSLLVNSLFGGFNYRRLILFDSEKNNLNTDSIASFQHFIIKRICNKVGKTLKFVCKDLHNLCGKEIVKHCLPWCEYDELKCANLLLKMLEWKGNIDYSKIGQGKTFMSITIGDNMGPQRWCEMHNVNWRVENVRHVMGRGVRLQSYNDLEGDLDYDGDEDNILQTNDNIIVEPIQTKQKYYNDNKNRHHHFTSKNIKFFGQNKNIKFQGHMKRVFQPIKGRK